MKIGIVVTMLDQCIGVLLILEHRIYFIFDRWSLNSNHCSDWCMRVSTADADGVASPSFLLIIEPGSRFLL